MEKFCDKGFKKVRSLKISLQNLTDLSVMQISRQWWRNDT